MVSVVEYYVVLFWTELNFWLMLKFYHLLHIYQMKWLYTCWCYRVSPCIYFTRNWPIQQYSSVNFSLILFCTKNKHFCLMKAEWAPITNINESLSAPDKVKLYGFYIFFHERGRDTSSDIYSYWTWISTEDWRMSVFLSRYVWPHPLCLLLVWPLTKWLCTYSRCDLHLQSAGSFLPLVAPAAPKW